MPKFSSPLDQVRVAAPCPADWGAMAGDERVRFCDRCSLNVYNLSGMSRREAEALVAGAEGRLCVRFYRRADGTVLTRNCPVGLRALRRRAARVAGSALSAALGFFAGVGLNSGVDRALSPSIMDASAVPAPAMPPPQPASPARDGTEPVMSEAARPLEHGQMVVGRIAVMGGILAEEYEREGDAASPRRRAGTRRGR